MRTYERDTDTRHFHADKSVRLPFACPNGCPSGVCLSSTLTQRVFIKGVAFSAPAPAISSKCKRFR